MLCAIYPFHTMRLRSVTETMKVSNSAQSKNQFLEKKKILKFLREIMN